MAFDTAQFVLLAHGRDRKLFYYDSGSDSIATVLGSGYIDNEDDAVRMSVGDIMIVVGNDATATLEVSSVSTGTPTFRPTSPSGVYEAVTDTTATLLSVGTSDLTDTAAKTYVLGTPFAGAIKYLIKTASSTAIVTINSGSTSVTFDGSNQNLTFDGAGEAVILVGKSSTRWLILSNQGTVGAS